MYDSLNYQLLHPLLHIVTLPIELLYDGESFFVDLRIIPEGTHVLQCCVVVEEYEEQLVEQFRGFNVGLEVLQPINQLLEQDSCEVRVEYTTLQVNPLNDPLSSSPEGLQRSFSEYGGVRLNHQTYHLNVRELLVLIRVLQLQFE